MIGLRNDFIAGTITVPERGAVITHVIKEFRDKNIEHKIFVDPEHKGHKWNITRMMMYFCHTSCDKNVIITMDDIFFMDGWLENVERVLRETNYDVITLFTNRNLNPDDDCDIHRATSNWWMYDHCVIFRQGVLCPEWFDGFMKFCNRPDKHQKEINHYDNMIGHYLIDSGYKCGIVRPNYIRLQKVKSILGHNIVVKE